MKNFPNLLLLGVLLLSVVSCTSPAAEKATAPDLVKIKAEIQAMEDAYAAAENAKDAEAVVVYYSDDAVNMPNNKPSVSGKAAILARIKEQMAKDSTGNTTVFEVVEVMAAGDMVIEAGKSTTTGTDGKVSTGKYLSIFEQRDGKYLCIRDIWNEDAEPEKK